MATAVFILTAYLIGSLSFAVIVSRAFSLPDPRTYGSGNPGATNGLRTGKKLAALLTLIGDGGKGGLAGFLAARYAAGYGVDATGVAACAGALVGFQSQVSGERDHRAVVGAEPQRRVEHAEFAARSGGIKHGAQANVGADAPRHDQTIQARCAHRRERFCNKDVGHGLLER